MRWSIRERDDQGEVIGTAYRAPDGSKSFEPGGKRGLIVDWPLPVYAGSSMDDPVFVCEGASDTAALMSVGLDAVGVPMAGQGGKLLAGVLNARHAVIVADNDDAGRRGAHKLSAALLGSCASVRVMPPPLGAKDAREAVLAGATGAGFKDEASGFLSFPVEPRGVPGKERKDSPGFEWVSLADIGP
ncbi:MAG: toprim domain-containing protein, partial [Phycisphaerales bacterium JB061]